MGAVYWSEFIAAALCIWTSQKEQRVLLDATFSRFDLDADGTLSAEELESLFAVGESRELWKERLPQEMAKVGKTPPFTKEEFVHFMTQRMRCSSGRGLVAVDA